MDHKERWQSKLDQTEKEIRTGQYSIEFSPTEIFYFPRPTKLQKWKLKYLAFLYLKLTKYLKLCRRNRVAPILEKTNGLTPVTQ